MPPLQQDITLYGAVGDEQSFGLQQNPVFSGPDLSLEVGVSTMSASMRVHAAEQGKANVIFFKPMEYDGPMPELPE